MGNANPPLSQQFSQTLADQSLSRRNYATSSQMKKWGIFLIVAVVCSIAGYLLGLNSQRSQTKKLTVVRQPITKITTKPRTPTEKLLGRAQPSSIKFTPVSGYATPTPNMANWISYSDRAGFSLKYPPEWQIDAMVSNFPDQQSQVYFTIKGSDPEKDPIRPNIQVTRNLYYLNDNASSNATLDQILQGQEATDNGTVGEPIQTVIGGYPAIRTSNSCQIEMYDIIAPGLQTPNAVYTISFLNYGPQCASAKNPYSISDPFVLQQLANFHLVISSIRFPTK